HAKVALFDLGDGSHRQAARESPSDAARNQQIADLDLVGALEVLHVAQVLAVVAGAADEAASAGALHDDVDAAAGVDDEADVDRVASALDRRAHDAIGRQNGQVRANVARLAVERNPNDAKEIIRVLADDLRAQRVGAQVRLQVEQALQPVILL